MNRHGLLIVIGILGILAIAVVMVINSTEILREAKLVFSTYLGGNDADGGSGIALDISGSAYVTGWTYSTNFPITNGAYQTIYGGDGDAFIAKFNSSGTGLIYSTYLGGDGDDSGFGIALDASGNAYVTGWTYSTNFPITSDAYQTTYGGGIADAFVAKLDSSGTSLIYSTYLGGGDDDSGSSIALDTSGNAYVTGWTNSANFPITSDAYRTVSGGGSDAFVTKFNSSDTGLIYSTYLGGNTSDTGTAITLDTAENAYVTGYTYSTDFPTTLGAYQTASGGGYDAFITKLNSSGTGLIYSTYLGGNSYDRGDGIVLASGNAYVTGETHSTNFPITSDAYQTAYGGGIADAFVTKLNSNGTGLIYSTFLGGGDDDYGNGMVLALGNVYVTGGTYSTNFPITTGAYQTAYGGIADAFVAKLDSSGTSLIYSTYLGGSDADSGSSIALDTSGNAYVAGWTNSANFPITSNAYQTTSYSANGTDRDAFVTKFYVP